VQGVALDLDDRVLAPSGGWTFGTAQARGTECDFTPCPDAEQKLAVVLTATVRVAPLWSWGPGRWIGVSTLNADVAAYYDTSSKPPRPRLIRARLVSTDGNS